MYPGLIDPVAKALPSLIEIFHELDVDESGLITHDEVPRANVLGWVRCFLGRHVPEDPPKYI